MPAFTHLANGRLGKAYEESIVVFYSLKRTSEKINEAIDSLLARQIPPYGGLERAGTATVAECVARDVVDGAVTELAL